MKKIYCLLLLMLVSSCVKRDPNKSIDEGKIDANIYTSNEIGWTIEIPKGWTIIDKETKQGFTDKGYDAVRETIGEDIDYGEMRNLIAFKKNSFNIFESTSEPFDIESDGDWHANNAALKEVIYLTYVDQGIKVDTTATIIEMIDNLEFYSYRFTIYSSEGDVILNQIIFSKLIKDFDFGVSINYNNPKDRDEMLAAFRNSKFK